MRRILALLLSLGAVSCADESSISVKYAEGYKPGRAGVSIFGVFRDGRMSIDSWLALSAPLSAALGGEGCEPAFGERLQRENEELFQSLDDEVRNNGITEDLYAKLTPRAQGDLILIVTVHGATGLTANDKQKAPTRTPSTAPPMRGAGGMRGPRGGSVREVSPRGPAVRPLELSASLYSIQRQKPVARLNMAYTGTSNEEAIRRFAIEVGAMAPGSTCKGWTFPGAAPASIKPLLDGP